MATSGRKLDEWTRQRIETRLRKGDSVYRIARNLDISEPTVRKIRKEMLTSFGNVCS
jgi:DNA-binding NarL/FixJ family response regulator